MLPLPDELETMEVASQASVSAEEDIGLESMKSLMRDMFAEFKNLQKEMAQNNHRVEQEPCYTHGTTTKGHGKSIGLQLQEMEMQMDQQRKEMDDFTKRSMSSVISQIPQLM
jgi:deferrochelatase/peroxidase EfeB